MIIKNYLIENDLNTIFKYKAFLIYGENEGFKKDLKNNIKNKYRDYDILNYFQDEIIKNENIFTQELLNKSLFEKNKIIFVNQVNDKIIGLLDIIENNKEDVKVIIFSDMLDKRSKLRAHFEKSKLCGISACYQDSEITLRKIIEKKLSGFTGLTPQIVNLIIKNTDLDRSKTNNEIEKIISFFKDKIIDSSKIETLLNIKTNNDFNLLRDEALNGNKVETNKLLADTFFELDSFILYLNSINHRFHRLNEIENLKKSGENTEVLIAKLKPPVFWKDKPIIMQQSRKWNKRKINSILKKTYETEMEIKSNSSIRKDLLIKNLLIDICVAANSA